MHAVMQLLKTMQKQIANQQPHTIINNDNRQQIINIITVNLGEGIAQINNAELIKAINNLPKNKVRSGVIKLIHGNPKYPDLQNVFMNELGDEFIMVFGEHEPGKKTWERVVKEEAIRIIHCELGTLLTTDLRMPNADLVETASKNGLSLVFQDKIYESIICQNIENNDDIEQSLVEIGNEFHH